MSEDLFFISLWIFGFRTLFQPGMILGFWGDEFDELLGKMAKPLFRCAPCMSSIHGSIYFIWRAFERPELVTSWPGFLFDLLWFVVLLTGLNWIITRVTSIAGEINEVRNLYNYFEDHKKSDREGRDEFGRTAKESQSPN